MPPRQAGERLRRRGWLAAACLVMLQGVPAHAEGTAPVPVGRPRIIRPVEQEVVQRRDRTGGTIPVEAMADLPGAGNVEARVASDDDAPWRRLERNGDRFRGALDAPAGGWHRLDVRFVVDGAVVALAHVERVGVGEVFVVAGQSNSANHGEEKLVPTDQRVVSLAPDGSWRPAADPQPGASGDGGSFLPAFGDLLVERFDVPIGFVACGIGATSVREWLPPGSRFPAPPTLTGHVRAVDGGGWESDGEAFAMLMRRMGQCGEGGFRALLWHQGESDANQADPSRTLPGPLYAEYLGRLIGAANREMERDVP